MYENIYLKNINTKQIIAILNRDAKIIENSTKETFEKLSISNSEEHENQKTQKLNKFQTEKNIYYFSVKNGLFTGVLTNETSNEKIYNDLITDILNEDRFRLINEIRNEDKDKEILEFYVTKHFTNPKVETSLKLIGNDSNLQIENISNNPNVDLYFPEADEEK